MAQIKNIANKIACSGANSANTGKLGCLSLFGTPTHFIALPRGKELVGTTDLTPAYMSPEVQKGVFIPIIDASSFEDVSSQDAYSSNSSTIKRLNVKGLPEYRLMFEEGHEFYRQLAKMESFKSYCFMIGDDMGNWMMVKKGNGNYTGFTAGHVTPELTKRKQKGGDAESKSLLVQFIDRMEWDQNYVILHQDELGWVPTDVPTVNGVNINYNSLPAAGNTVSVNVTLSADNKTLVEGLVTADFKGIVDGNDNIVTNVVEDSPGNYTITFTNPLVAGEKLTVVTWDDTLKVYTVASNSILYKVNMEEVEVIA